MHIQCGERFGQLVAPASANQRKDVITARGNPGYGNLSHAYAKPVRHLAQGLDQGQVVIDIAVLKARALRAEIAGARALFRPMSAHQAAGKDSIGGDGYAERAAGRENAVLDATRDQGVFDLKVANGM